MTVTGSAQDEWLLEMLGRENRGAEAWREPIIRFDTI
jgi:hypothetical protein